MAGHTQAIAILWLAGLTALTPSARAAAPKPSEREAMYQRYLEFASYMKGGSVTPHWMADGSSFWYAEGEGANKRFYKVDPAANPRSPLLDIPRLREALRTLEPERAWPAELVVDQLSLLNGDTEARLTIAGQEYLVRLDTYAVSEAPPVRPSLPRETEEELSPDGRWLVGIQDYNLYLRSTAVGQTRRLTTDGEQWYEWDLKDRAFDSATTWSPDRSKLAVKKVDYRQVPEAHRPVPPGVSPRGRAWHSRSGQSISGCRPWSDGSPRDPGPRCRSPRAGPGAAVHGPRTGRDLRTLLWGVHGSARDVHRARGLPCGLCRRRVRRARRHSSPPT